VPLGGAVCVASLSLLPKLIRVIVLRCNAKCKMRLRVLKLEVFPWNSNALYFLYEMNVITGVDSESA
jgi:hypothetical protein